MAKQQSDSERVILTVIVFVKVILAVMYDIDSTVKVIVTVIE